MMTDLTNLRMDRACDRISLRTLTTDNASESYYQWLQDPDILCFLEIRHAGTQSQEQIKDFVQNMLLSPADLMMGIFLNEDDRHIGNIKLGGIDRKYQRGDIGVIIGDKSAWGKGFATEAISGICNIAFEDIELQRVHAGAYSGNIASIKAFERAGFKREALLREHWNDDAGRKHDGIILGLLASDYFSRL